MRVRSISSSDSQNTLEYAPRSRRRHWRRFFRAALILVVLGILVAGAWHREYISFRLREAYWFSRCMNHVTPPGTVRLEFDSTKAKALIDQNPEYFDVNTYVLRTPKGSYPAYSNRSSFVAQYVPREIRELERFVLLTPSSSDFATVFAGERRTPSGKRRLLIMRGASMCYAGFPHTMRPVLFEPPNAFHGAKPLITDPKTYYLSGPATVFDVHLIDAVADQVNKSRVTVHFTVSGADGFHSRMNIPKSGTVDIDLLDNDTLNFKVNPDPLSTEQSQE